MQRRHLLPVVTALLLVTAGCSAFAGGDASSTTDPATTTEAPTTTSSDLPDASTVAADALDAMQAVETYRVNGTIDETEVRDLNETVRTWQRNTSIRAAFDRVNHRFRFNETAQRQLNVTVRDESAVALDNGTWTDSGTEYLVNGTAYSPDTNQSNTTWTKQDLWDPADSYDRRDTLAHQRTLLNASNVTVTGTDTVGGVETYVLQADATDASVVPWPKKPPMSIDNPNVDVHDGLYQFYVATESGRLMKSVTHMNETPVTESADSNRINRTTTYRFDYDGTVAISLPPDVQDAEPSGSES